MPANRVFSWFELEFLREPAAAILTLRWPPVSSNIMRESTMPRSLTALGAAVGDLLKQRGQTIAVAESSAGGVINAALVAVPGASAYYLGGGVIYTPKGRASLLGIGKDE